MIKFFRKIRQRLLSENKLSKYLVYAIGEIILVVIGILIALQINNFNDQVNKRKQEQEYLQSLKLEFKNNLAKLHNSSNNVAQEMEAVKSLLSLFSDEIRDTVSDQVISDYIFRVFARETVYRPSVNVLKDLISSGNLNLIQNKILREYLLSFETTIEFVKEQEESISIRKEEMQKLLNENGSVRNVLFNKGMRFDYSTASESLSNKSMFESVEFENDILTYYLSKSAIKTDTLYGQVRSKMEKILKEINQSISE